MPSFQQALAEEPETFWNLVAYVLYVADVRRRETLGEEPPQLAAVGTLAEEQGLPAEPPADDPALDEEMEEDAPADDSPAEETSESESVEATGD